MAVNFQQVHNRIQEIGQTARQRRRALEERRRLAREQLARFARDLEHLRTKVEAARRIDAGIRCALPGSEELTTHLPCPPAPAHAILIAADGSQVAPDRHAAVQFGLVNVGAIIMDYRSGSAPQVVTESELLFDQELLVNGSPMTDGMVALARDVRERRQLDELSRPYAGQAIPVITFTDGPIELWGAQEGEAAGRFRDELRKYLSALSHLQERGVTTAGYVDKPGSDLLVRLLEIAMAAGTDMERIRDYRPLLGVTDRYLLGSTEGPLLGANERSAVFALQSRAEKDYSGGLALHFFYLNVGSNAHPQLARVEIPRWVAEDSGALDNLHAMLVDQCRALAARPYPYLLHRAHETAVVSLAEKLQVEQLLTQELRRSDGEVGEQSNKQFTKDSTHTKGHYS